MKISFSPTLIFFAFTGISAFIVYKMTGETGDLLAIASLILPIICYVVTLFFMQARGLVRLIFELLCLPFRLFGIGRKRNEDDESLPDEKVSRSYGLSAIFISGFLYWVVGNFLINHRNVNFPLIVYSCMGLFWGFLLYISYQKGVVDEMESEF